MIMNLDDQELQNVTGGTSAPKFHLYCAKSDTRLTFQKYYTQQDEALQKKAELEAQGYECEIG